MPTSTAWYGRREGSSRRSDVRRPSPFVRYSRYGGLAFEFSGAVLSGAVLGFVLDRWVGSDPAAIIVCTLLGVAGGFFRLVQLLRRFERQDREAER